ncbi:MAG: biotin transporter BioY [Oscillospiraceae bacterium]|jgi:biotin transport system substrate-specific component|nr:biotin transporter BioY [Oscillospiraceae bacterium]
MNQPKRPLVLSLALTALFAALSAALSQLSIPLGAVPIVLTQVSIFLAAGLLGWKWGTLSQLLFVAMGALGLPVFAGFKGGPGALFGPTGGFLIGYLLAALAAGLLMDKFGRSFKTVLPICVLAALLIYVPGLPWLAHAAHLVGLKKILAAGMLPYLPGDALKIALCALLIPRLYPLIKRPSRR